MNGIRCATALFITRALRSTRSWPRPESQANESGYPVVFSGRGAGPAWQELWWTFGTRTGTECITTVFSAPTATMAIMIVERALISGETPSLTAENILIGSVVADGPAVNEAITRSSSERVNASNHPEITDGAISNLIGTTRTTIAAIRDRSHWNIANITPKDPVTLGLCSQRELDAIVAKAAKAAGIEQPTDTRLEGDREALIEELRAERQQAALDAEAAARAETEGEKPAFEDPFKR